MKKTIGIVGGMGPLATVDLFQKIVENTKAKCDMDHIHIIIDNDPQIPDRTKSILEHGPSPVKKIIESCKRLQAAGADVLAIPCNTSHYYYSEITNQCEIPVINMLDETMNYLCDLGIGAAVLFATDGTIQTGIYDYYAQKYDIKIIKPNGKEQQEIMNVIYCGIKAGNNDFDSCHIQSIIDYYADMKMPVILGCTELPLAVRKYGLKGAFVDTTLILAKRAITLAGYETNEL